MASDPGLASMQEHASSGQRGQSHQKHEVFLSHSGKQKETFVKDLFREFLNSPRFQSNPPFFDVDDDCLPKGEDWRDRLIKAARNCKVAVMILTPDFLTSKWPMLELLHFIDARKGSNPGMKLLPVFYDPKTVSPAELDDQSIVKMWKEAWEKIIAKESSATAREVAFTVESCKRALRILKNINGIKRPEGQSNGELQKTIVEKVLKYLPSGYDPEINSEVEGFRRLCDMIAQMFQPMIQSDDKEIQCLGMYGLGGSGKTTMCKALCSYFGPSFNHKVYHLQIGSNANQDRGKLLQDRHKELLRNLFGLEWEKIDRNQDPRKILKMYFDKQPVFLAVDNVRDDLESCEEVRAYMSYLCRRSKIIIASRSRKIVESVIGDPIYCKPIPNLNTEEALALFLKIAAPKRKPTELDPNETWILEECLQICNFSLEESDGEVRHYHPLALRAAASYFKDQYAKLDSIVQCGEKLLDKKRLLFHSSASERIFDILGFGFHEMCALGKQLFVDVALFAPKHDADDIDVTFKWLVDIHVDIEPPFIQLELEHLRKVSFLYFDDGHGNCPCVNINMHDLYREYAKKLVNKRENEDSYKYGVYNYQYRQAPPTLAPTGWAKAPRIRLKRWEDVITMEQWCKVSVIHLIFCETIKTLSIGRELVNLRHLKIHCCSKLEELSWTQDIVTTGPQGMRLCNVELMINKSLKILPDFSECSELRDLVVIECSSLVEPLQLHNCPSLQVLFLDENAPEVQSLQSCETLRSVHLAWRASHRRLQVRNLPSLSTLRIVGPSVLPKDSPNKYLMPHGHNLFCQHYPAETVCYNLEGIRELTKLETLSLEYLPLGCLPKGLREIGSNLKHLNFRGCLLNQLVDFSDFPNLQRLSIAQTNVKELRGVGCLKKLVKLDCRYNFRLQKIQNLRRSTRLKSVYLDQCPDLHAIPRLPSSYCETGPTSSEDLHRMRLARYAFMNTTSSVIPPPLFALFRDLFSDRSLTPSTTWKNFNTEVNIELSHLSISGLLPNLIPHLGVTCDGCMMQPLIGPRYKARDIRTSYNLCSKCFGNKCHRDDCNFIKTKQPRTYIFTTVVVMNYDLCSTCFKESGCDERDFYPGILATDR